MRPDALADLAEAFDLTEADIDDLAQRAAAQVQAFAELWQSTSAPELKALASLRRMARGYRVDLPPRANLAELLNRMRTAAWWRAALRKRFRIVEQHQRCIGAVHRAAAPYVSDKAMRRQQRNAERIAALLASLQATNLDTGESIPLQELADKSQANPAMRRAAMMWRIRGVESDAKAKGHEAAFVTLTAPGRMHARHFTGAANERFDGSTPDEVQRYLGDLWRKATRAAKHQGLAPYGLRTVEPHHDGCPHWHLLVFGPKEQTEAFIATLRAYALADSPEEPGAALRRLDVEWIDPTRGSAAGYAAKYVAKNIDGYGLDADDESGQAGARAAARIVAWARLWRIRQFQFFGLPPITPTRELYRLPTVGEPASALGQAHEACKGKDYAGYLRVLADSALRLRVDYLTKPSARYAGELAKAIHGVLASGADLAAQRVVVTRTERWAIEPRAGTQRTEAGALPWTRFNNCAPPCASTAYARAPDALSIDAREGRRRRPRERTGPALEPA